MAQKAEAKPAPAKPATAKAPDIASASVPDTLAALHVNPDTGLTHAEVDARRKEHGYNEVAEKKAHPVLKFLGKFWGMSAWMLELIMVLSAVLGKYSDLAVVGALLVVNAVLSFMQEHRAAGVVEALRRRLQVSARVRRDVELAGHSRPGAGPRRHRPRAPGRHHPGGREAPHRSVERRPVGAHRRIEGRGQGARRRAVVGVRRPPGRRQRRGHADRGEDLLWPHHRAGAAGAAEAPHRSGGGQGRPLALRHRRRAAGRGGRRCR